MLQELLELETLFNNKQIKMTNQHFNERIQEFNFVLLIKDNYEKEIYLRKNESKIITIDYYDSNDEIKNHEYFTICIDKTIFVISKSNSFILKYFFSNFSDSTIYCLSENIANFLEETYLVIQNKFSKKSQNKSIVSQVDYLFVFFDASNFKINKILKKIKRCILGYLIQKSYQNSNINRIDHTIINNNINISKTKNINEKYIEIKNFNNFRSQVRLTYNAEDEKLYIIKNHTDYNDKITLQERELDNYKHLKHPLLPKLYEAYKNENGETFLVIEYIVGETIDKYDISSLTEHEIINIILELMISIHYINSKGYVCRDIKPSNVIIDYNKTAILIDFDRIVNIKNKDEEFSKDFGYSYASPELYNGEPFSYNTDVFSLGKLINDMILNKKNNITDKIKNKLKKMCQYCMIKDKEKRFSISILIRYFYINILVKNDEIKETENELIKILEYNFNNELNDPEGLCTLGMIYEQGAYVKQNFNQAIKYYEKASNLNDLISKINLSMIYSNIPNAIAFTNTFIHNSLETLEGGIKQNNPYSQFWFGIYKYIYSQSTIDKDFAIYYIKLAADQKYIPAQFFLGCLCFNNTDYKSAYNYFFQVINYPKIKNQKNNDFLKYNGYILPNSDIIFDYEICSELSKMLSYFFWDILSEWTICHKKYQ